MKYTTTAAKTDDAIHLIFDKKYKWTIEQMYPVIKKLCFINLSKRNTSFKIYGCITNN